MKLVYMSYLPHACYTAAHLILDVSTSKISDRRNNDFFHPHFTSFFIGLSQRFVPTHP